MASNAPQQVVSIEASAPSIGAYSFYATANSGAFSGNLYDGGGNTIGTYSSTGLVSGTNYTALTVVGTITFASDPAATTYNQLKQFGTADIAGYTLPASIAASLNFTTGLLTGQFASASSPVAGTVVGRIAQTGVGAADSISVTVPNPLPVTGTVATTAADGSNVVLGATTDAAVTTNTTGTVSGKLRGVVALLASVISGGAMAVSGAASAFVDGSLVTLGTTTQTKATDGSATSWSVIQLLKGIFDTLLNSLSVALKAGTAIIGKVGIDQTTPGTTNGVSPVDLGPTTASITAQDAASTSVTNFLGQTVITGTPTANSSAQSNASGDSTIRIQMKTANFIGTVQVEKSIDGGTTWRLDGGITTPGGTLPTAASFVFPGTAQTVLARTDAAALTQVRVRCTAYTSGTLTVLFQTGYGVVEIDLSNNFGQGTKATSLPVTMASDQTQAAPTVVTPTFTNPACANNGQNNALASNASRKGLEIQNGTSGVISFNFTATAPTSIVPSNTNVCFTIQPQQIWTPPPGMIITGPVSVCQQSGASTQLIGFLELV